MTHIAERAPWLRRLARYTGILDRYVDQGGTEVRATSDATRRAILHALGAEAANERQARASLARLHADDRAEVIAPVRVVGGRDPSRRLLRIARATRGPCLVVITSDDGVTRRVTGRANAPAASGADLRLPDLPIGYHRLVLACTHGVVERRYTQMLIVVPPRCTQPAERLGPDRVFGLIANLYSIRSAANWGVGDFSDLALLATWGGGLGADFVGVNPLHALLDRGTDISPYSPASRLFRNPIYIDVAQVPELAHAGSLARELADGPLRARIEGLREPADIRYEQVMAVKHLALDALHRVFLERARSGPADRVRAYDAYVRGHGTALDHFATWMAIAETAHGGDWRRWPVGLRDPDSHAMRAFGAEHAARVDYHRWVQFEADRQLGAAAVSAADAGMRIGLYQDLAIGGAPGGADTWAHPALFALGASIGAPPDPYAREGQQWGLPPLVPRALRAQAYEYFINVVRAGFRHAGALRIDHVMGLFRLFWIPDGLPAREGAYVRYPARDLLGILALESARHRALVVGEDLGTVPPEVPPALRQWGILSSKVLYFERTRRGFKSSAAYPARALATANTHDLPTIEAFWRGADIDLRARVGLVSGDDAAHARDAREGERRALLRRLVAEKTLPAASAPASPAQRCGAVHAFLCRTPSRLVGLSLDDLTGEVEPVNLPGAGPERYPSWTRRMRTPLEVAMRSDDVRVALRCSGRARGSRVAGERRLHRS